jgi:hypothetical protein
MTSYNAQPNSRHHESAGSPARRFSLFFGSVSVFSFAQRRDHQQRATTKRAPTTCMRERLTAANRKKGIPLRFLTEVETVLTIAVMSLTRLPMELQIEIIVEVVLVHCATHRVPHFVASEIVPYLRTSDIAFACWREHEHIILHRVAMFHLRASRVVWLTARRTYLLARLKRLVWLAAFLQPSSHVNFYRQRFKDASRALFPAAVKWEFEKGIAEYWSGMLIQ